MGTRYEPGRSEERRAGDGGLGRRIDDRQVDDRTIGGLIRELGDESSRLLREEVQLAKTEVREKAEVYQRNGVKMVVGGAMLVGALFVLLAAVNRGLTVLLDTFMSLEVAVWLAPLLLAAVIAAIGWSMVKNAQRAVKREGIMPDRTLDTLRDEKDWVQQHAREVRHG